MWNNWEKIDRTRIRMQKKWGNETKNAERTSAMGFCVWLKDGSKTNFTLHCKAWKVPKNCAGRQGSFCTHNPKSSVTVVFQTKSATAPPFLDDFDGNRGDRRTHFEIKSEVEGSSLFSHFFIHTNKTFFCDVNANRWHQMAFSKPNRRLKSTMYVFYFRRKVSQKHGWKSGSPPRNGKICSDPPLTPHFKERRGDRGAPFMPFWAFCGNLPQLFWNPKIGEFLITFPWLHFVSWVKCTKKRATKISSVRPKKNNGRLSRFQVVICLKS